MELSFLNTERKPIHDDVSCTHGCKHMVQFSFGKYFVFDLCEVDAFYYGQNIIKTAMSRDNYNLGRY